MKKKLLHLISWNVNGLRSVLKRDALRPILELKPAILCLQETKVTPASAPESKFEQFPYKYFHFAQKSAYAGTATFSTLKPVAVSYDLPSAEFKHPQEGRVITTEFAHFTLVNVYVPNSQHGLTRLKYRTEAWDLDFRHYLEKLSKRKPTIICGDLNVAHTEIDIANPKANRRNAGFTDEERENFTQLLGSGFVDTFRDQHPNEPGNYTWWSYRFNARARNIGWRVDYFLASTELHKNIEEASILANIKGADHSPISLKIKIEA